MIFILLICPTATALAADDVLSEVQQPGTTYWLVLHQSIKDINGSCLNQAALAVAKTAGSPVTVQSLGARVKPQPEKVNPVSDYVQAILDLSD